MTALDSIKGRILEYAPAIYLRRSFYTAISLLTGNRAFNYINYLWAVKRIKECQGKPPETLLIETTSYCNAKCSMCGQPTMKRKKGTMDLALFEKIVEDAGRSGIRLISLANVGEPLMDDKLFERIRFIKKHGIKVMFHTNGALLDKEKAGLIVETGVDDVTVSLDTSSRETYEKVRGGLPFERVVSNVLNLMELKKRKGVLLPVVKVNFTIQDENIHEIRSFYDFWNKKVDGVNIHLVHNWAGKYDVACGSSCHINTSLPPRNPCRAIWKEMVVLYDGRVSLCCYDYEGSSIMGDLKSRGIMEVWSGEKFREYRKKFLENKRGSLPLCRRCTKYSFWF